MAGSANLACSWIASRRRTFRQGACSPCAAGGRPASAGLPDDSNAHPRSCSAPPGVAAEGRERAHPRYDRRGLRQRPESRCRSGCRWRRGDRSKDCSRNRKGRCGDYRREPVANETKEVNQTELAARLKLDKAAVSRRVADCLERGYLRNLEERRPGKGRPARLVLGDQLPSEQEILPGPELVDPLIGCLGGKATTPSPSPNGNGASLPVCVTCGREDDPDDPLTAPDMAGRRVWVHAVCRPFWEEQGRPTERPSADG